MNFFKRNKLSVILGLVLIALIAGGAATNIRSLWLELTVSDTYGIQMRDTSDTVRFRLGIDSAISGFNSSGDPIWGYDNLGGFEGGVAYDRTAASWTANQGFVITASAGNVWEIDLSLATNSSAGAGDAIGKATAGVTVYLPQTITETMDGQPMTFIIVGPKAAAGTTNMVLWAGATATSGVSIENSTGVTNDALDADAEGDSITLIPSYSKQIYFYGGSRIQ